MGIETERERERGIERGIVRAGRTFATSLISFIAFNNLSFRRLAAATKTCAD